VLLSDFETQYPNDRAEAIARQMRLSLGK